MGKVSEVKRKEYALTIRIPISGIDDCDARAIAKKLISNITDSVDDTAMIVEIRTKLQEMHSNKPPRGVQI